MGVHSFPVSGLFGLPFDVVTMPDVLDHIDELVNAAEPSYITTANLDFATQAENDDELQQIIFDAALNICDGVPLVWASKWLPRAINERVAGADLVPYLLERAAERGHRIFILGSTEDVLERAVRTSRETYPELIISGYYSPPITELDNFDDSTIEARIRIAAPDILLVAMGCPKQEKWISRHHKNLGVPVSIGVGASIDFLAGEVRRAPTYMQRVGGEWIFRLSQDPGRLGKRYARDLRFYVRGMARLTTSRVAITGHHKPRATISRSSLNTLRVTWSGSFDTHMLDDSITPLTSIDAVQQVILDCRRVTHMDDVGVAEFIRLLRLCRRAGAALVLTEPSAAAWRAISDAGLDRLIEQYAEMPHMIPERRAPHLSVTG